MTRLRCNPSSDLVAVIQVAVIGWQEINRHLCKREAACITRAISPSQMTIVCLVGDLVVDLSLRMAEKTPSTRKTHLIAPWYNYYLTFFVLLFCSSLKVTPQNRSRWEGASSLTTAWALWHGLYIHIHIHSYIYLFSYCDMVYTYM